MKNMLSKKALSIGIVLFIFCYGTGPLFGKDGEHEKKGKGIVERFNEGQKQAQAKESGQSGNKEDAAVNFVPDFTPIVLENEQAKEAMFVAFKSYYEYRTKGFEHRKRVFAWQLLSSKIIFFVVIFLVLAGVYFSWMQFHKKMDDEKAGDPPSRASDVKRLEYVTTFSVSAKEIKVSSPVLGVIILVISLLFFYLYLVYVFPIEEIL
ncbi:MAG: hypothetical protein J7K32_00795 [Deltaproteobacteria bacterium]|nr:hypothetical protein [Deltaproteobacteria bacterium]